MFSDLISIGDKIEIQKISYNEIKEGQEKRYISQLLEYNEEQEATIAVPIVGSVVIPLEVGAKYQLCFYTKKGLYQCEGIITSRSKEESLYIMSVKFTSDFEKYQRRQYYRLNCILDLEYRIETQLEESLVDKVQAENADSKEHLEQLKAQLEEIQNAWDIGSVNDISGGGVRFISQKECNIGDKMRLKIFFEQENMVEHIVLKAKVIASTKVPHKFGYYEIRVEFIEINHLQREEIIRYIFQEERRIRRREKGFE